ncbi:hypothetical protein ACTXT7_011232, partial [Hymenolepis weldensis]
MSSVCGFMPWWNEFWQPNFLPRIHTQEYCPICHEVVPTTLVRNIWLPQNCDVTVYRPSLVEK